MKTDQQEKIAKGTNILEKIAKGTNILEKIAKENVNPSEIKVIFA